MKKFVEDGGVRYEVVNCGDRHCLTSIEKTQIPGGSMRAIGGVPFYAFSVWTEEWKMGFLRISIKPLSYGINWFPLTNLATKDAANEILAQ